MFIYREEYYDKSPSGRARRTSSSPSTATARSARSCSPSQREYPRFMNYAGDRFAQ